MASVNPYINFNGNCAEAFDFYKSVFGGDFMGAPVYYRDVPDMPHAADEGSKIMHVALPIGSTVLMGSDFPNMMGEFKPGNNFSVAISAESEEEARRLFAALSEGGQVQMPLERAPWGALYGGCKDRFGIDWGINYQFDAQQG